MRSFTALIVLCLVRITLAAPPESEWVHPGADGKLVYKSTPRGDRILDYSFAGYRSGGVALPDVPVVKTLAPSGAEDDSAAIQSALDEISARPMKDGFRGTLLLQPGVFNCARPIVIKSAGVVLRGSGSTAGGGTTLNLTGAPHIGISIGSNAPSRPAGDTLAITDSYVPSGAASFQVADPAGFKAGDAILIHKPATPKW